MSSDEQQSAQQTIIANSSFIGQVEESIPGLDWKHYVERVEMFFEVKSRCLRKPGRVKRWGSADFLQINTI